MLGQSTANASSLYQAHQHPGLYLKDLQGNFLPDNLCLALCILIRFLVVDLHLDH